MNWKRNGIVLSVAICFCLSPAWTEENANNSHKALTVDDAVKMALQTHVDIQRSSLSLEQASRNYQHSWNSFLPSVSAEGTGAGKRIYKDTDTDTLSVDVGMSASLSIDAGLSDAIKKLKSVYDTESASYEDTVRQVECTVRKAFYALLYLKEEYAMSCTTLASYQRQYDQTLQKRDRGVVSELDLLTAEVNLETAKPDVDSALASYTNSLREFLDMIGLEDEEGIELTGTLDYAESAQTINSSILEGSAEKSSEVRSLKNDLRTAELSRQSTYYSLFLPSVTVGASIFPEQYAYERIADTDSRTPYWNVSLSLSLPLDCWAPGSSARDKVAELDDTVGDLKLQLNDKRKTVQTSTREKLSNIKLSQSTLKARHQNLELAKRSYEMTEDAYRRGTKDLLTLQSALDTWHSAELQLRSEQYTLICNVLDLENALSYPAGTFFAHKEEETRK
jgi:outer membrane protein TolC